MFTVNNQSQYLHRKVFKTNPELMTYISEYFKAQACGSRKEGGGGGGGGFEAQNTLIIKTAFLLTIIRNRKRWNRGIVNGMWQFLGVGWARTVLHLFRLFHLREWNSWKSRNGWSSCDRFGWTLDIYSRIEWFLFHLNWNRWSSECLFQVSLFLKSLQRNAA